jgi:hypothetical protein
VTLPLRHGRRRREEETRRKQVKRDSTTKGVVEGGFVNSEGLSMSLTARLHQSRSSISMYTSRAEEAFPCTSAEQQHHFHVRQQGSSSISMYVSRAASSFHVRQQSSSSISMYVSRAAASFPCTPADQQHHFHVLQQSNSSNSNTQQESRRAEVAVSISIL